MRFSDASPPQEPAAVGYHAEGRMRYGFLAIVFELELSSRNSNGVVVLPRTLGPEHTRSHRLDIATPLTQSQFNS
jgi:hypothetical protein